MDDLKLDLCVVRHAETDWTRTRRFCGWSDPPLSNEGRAQARALRPLLTEQIFDSIVSSSSARAVETARLAYGEPQLDERLRELDFGDLEGTTWDDCSEQVRAALLEYDTFEAPNGESVGQMKLRVTAALTDLGPGRHLVVTHGGVIRFLLVHAGLSEYPAPASVTPLRVTLTGDGSMLVREGSRGAR